MKVRTIKLNIIICPECLPRIKRFKKYKDLNIHLKLKHNSKYKVKIINNSDIVLVPREMTKIHTFNDHGIVS